MSANAEVIAFRTEATDITTAKDANSSVDVVLYERSTSTATLVSRRAPTLSSGTAGGESLGRVSADGRWVVFTSTAPNLVPGQVDRRDSTDIFLHDRLSGVTTLVSHAAGAPATAGNKPSFDPVVSADGAFVAFVSRATDLVAGADANDTADDPLFLTEANFAEPKPLTDTDIFLYERATGIITLVSEAAGAPGTTGNGLSSRPTISADGAFVAFVSSATDLVAGMNGSGSNVFLYSRATADNTLVSHVPGASSTAGNGASRTATISANGASVVFVSSATDLVTGTDANGGGNDIFLYDRVTGVVTLVSHAPGQPGKTGNSGADSPVISADGGVVAFVSTAGDLVTVGADPYAFGNNVFVYERRTGTVTLVNHAAGDPGRSASPGVTPGNPPVLSADGAFVAFVSSSAELAIGAGSNGTSPDVFLYRRATGSLRLVSHAAGAPGRAGNGFSVSPLLSADGGIVLFLSAATNLLDPSSVPPFSRYNLYLYELATDTVSLVGHVPGDPGTPAMLGAWGASLSADGTVIAFSIWGPDLVADDFNSNLDLFVTLYTRSTGPLPDDPPLPPAPGPDLVETSVSNPPPAAAPGTRFSVTDTVLNRGTTDAQASATGYYLSLTAGKTGSSVALAETRVIRVLAAGASSAGTKVLTVPAFIAPGTYYLLACADDTARVPESSETNNCTAAATLVVVGRPDLVVTAVSDPPTTVTRGSNFSVTDTVTNQSLVRADNSRTRYFLSLNTQKDSGDRMLAASRTVPALDGGASFAAPAFTLRIPTDMVSGTYFLLACADDLRLVLESSETNNCTASAGTVTVP